MDPPPSQHFCENFQQPMIWLGSDWKLSKISHCMQMDHVIDCATAPIFLRGPTDTVRFDACGSARSEQANAATSKGAVRLSFWKHSNRSICRTARCLPWQRLDSASHSAPRFQGPRPTAAALRCRVRLAICQFFARCLPEERFFCVVPAGRPVPVSSWRFL